MLYLLEQSILNNLSAQLQQTDKSSVFICVHLWTPSQLQLPLF